MEAVVVCPPRLNKIKNKKAQSPDPVGLDLGHAAAVGSAPAHAATAAPPMARSAPMAGSTPSMAMEAGAGGGGAVRR